MCNALQVLFRIIFHDKKGNPDDPKTVHFNAVPILIAAGSLSAAEKLNRGVVALPKERGKVFVSWRLLESDPADVAFNIYRREVISDRIEKITPAPVKNATCWMDENLKVGDLYRYSVRPVKGGKEGDPWEEISAGLAV